MAVLFSNRATLFVWVQLWRMLACSSRRRRRCLPDEEAEGRCFTRKQLAESEPNLPRSHERGYDLGGAVAREGCVSCRRRRQEAVETVAYSKTIGGIEAVFPTLSRARLRSWRSGGTGWLLLLQATMSGGGGIAFPNGFSEPKKRSPQISKQAADSRPAAHSP